MTAAPSAEVSKNFAICITVSFGHRALPWIEPAAPKCQEALCRNGSRSANLKANFPGRGELLQGAGLRVRGVNGRVLAFAKPEPQKDHNQDKQQGGQCQERWVRTLVWITVRHRRDLPLVGCLAACACGRNEAREFDYPRTVSENNCAFKIAFLTVGLWRSWERASMAWKRSSVRSRPGPPKFRLS